MARQSTGKRLRFEVFKRDAFTCRYCGAQPPDVVLVADHLIPVSAGGPTTLENLVTACEPCNQGKSDRLLSHTPPSPNTDLLYLETQQEIAELRRYQRSLQEREDVMRELILTLGDMWTEVSGLDWSPSDQVLRSLLIRFSPGIVGDALADVAAKVGGGYLPSYGRRWVAYLNTVAQTLAREREAGGADDGGDS